MAGIGTDKILRVLRRWGPEAALFVVGGTILAVQLFLPHYIGLADNGDFPKVAGRMALWPVHDEYKFQYFSPDYLRSGRRWFSDVWSSEIWPAKLADYASGVHRPGDTFNIRWLGAVHTALFLAAFALLLAALGPLPPPARVMVGAASVWMFTDVAYVSYLNSFYSDAAALLGLLGLVATAALIARHGCRAWLVAGYLLFGALLIGSKQQHALWAFLPAAFVLAAGWRDGRRRDRVGGAMAALALVGSACATMAMIPKRYAADPLFTVIFLKLARTQDATSLATLEELGLARKDLRYAGLYTYHTESPTRSNEWVQDFMRRTNYGKVAKWYLRHPGRALGILNEDLGSYGWMLRGSYIANLQK